MMSNPIQTIAEEEDGELNHLHILLINAYHRGYGWTDTQTDGVVDTFMSLADDVIISVEYLDWKRYPDRRNLERQLELMRYKYEDKGIDIVIATDDIGMQFAIDNRPVLFPDVPIVFSGVFEDSAYARSEGVANITGVIEKIDPFGTMEIITELHPDMAHIYVVNDSSESGVDVQNAILEAVEAYAVDYTYEVLDSYTYDELVEMMKTPKENSVIFMGTYNFDAEGKVIPNELFAQTLSTTSAIPIYTTYEYLFDYGVVGGSLLSGYLQGERAAQIAVEILEGRDIATIPIDTVATVYNAFDHEHVIRYGIDLDILDMDYSIINKPESIYETYRTVILTTLSIIGLLLAFIIILSFNIVKRKRTQALLDKEHKKLLNTYEALASSEEELIAQNNELMEQQEQIRNMAHHDYLTGLPNRLAVSVSTDRLLEKAMLHGKLVMVAFIDLDNFNYINTSYGHMVGDEVLKAVSSRVRDSKPHEGTFARIGGDEFVYLQTVDNEETAFEVAVALHGLFAEGFDVGNNVIGVTASMGYSIYPDDGESYDTLLNKADIAMYGMKKDSKDDVKRFEATMNDELIEKINISHALPIGLKEKEFHVCYQPQFNHISGKITGYEALIRWHSSSLGDVSPGRFIHIAEQTGDIIEIGKFVLEQAIDFQKRIAGRDGECIKIAVNISVAQIQRDTFANEVIELFEENGAKAECFELEITESVFINSFELVNTQLEKLKAYGFAIALDDFGTGYSSLTYLRQLPITTLKIDKSFIDDIMIEGDRHFMTASIVEIAHQLGYDVVAEGVELEQQVAYLEACDCQIIQGYWYSKPKSSEELLKS